MSNPLLQTKLYQPRPRRRLVTRPRLMERLDEGADATLILVSAPAGFGKTTAIVSWLSRLDQPPAVAWLSLDDGDREPARFWTYVLAALQSAAPGLDMDPTLLAASPPLPVETFLTAVVNQLRSVPHETYLVLDDYHLADGPDIAGGLAFLLDHAPPQLHVVLGTRADPALPLARLRARGELWEVRAADLRFTSDEVSDYLTEKGGLQLSQRDLATLEARTEGWIAALQLAALSLVDHPDPSGFIEGFAGDDRYLVDYLVEEVLARQPPDVRRFLLQTSILDRLTGALCEVVTGQPDGRGLLERLHRGNLFLVPLDNHRQWYRYHHLFGNVLQAHLRDERPQEIADLHRRASRWYREVDDLQPAIRHALAGGEDLSGAAELMELALPTLRRERQEALIRRWTGLLPDEVVNARPVLAVGFVGALAASGDFDDVPRRLHNIERELLRMGAGEAADPTASTTVDDRAALDALPGAVELYWAANALTRNDPAETVRHAQLAIERAAGDDHVTRAGAAALSGLASWGAGDLDAAHRSYSICVDGLRRAGHVADVLGCTITLGDLRVTQGRLTEALESYEQALALAARQPGVPRGTADMCVGVAHIYLERNSLALAAEYLQRSDALGEHLGLPQHPYRWRRATALLRAAQGDVDGALALLEQAQQVHTSDFSPLVQPVPALAARLLAGSGRVDAAMTWASGRGLSADDDLSYVREYEHVTLARVLLAAHRARGRKADLHQALTLLTRLLAAADAGGRAGSAVEIAVLLSLARQSAGDTSGAVTALEQALVRAEPEGYVRVVAAEGEPMAILLRRLAAQRPDWVYPRRLLAACAAERPVGAIEPAGADPTPDAERLLDPLSERELEVLRLLATDLSGPELARHLVVSLNTLRTHTKHIYAKLNVTSRRAAVRRARELNLLLG